MYYVDSHPTLPEQYAVYATNVISKGTLVFDLSSLPVVEDNSRYAITLKDGLYIDTINSNSRLINHSCDPNLLFDIATRTFTAIREINKDDMLTFDYLTTEKHMVEPFNCTCNAKNCRGYINGYDNTNKQILCCDI
jgi:hypothetical protein